MKEQKTLNDLIEDIKKDICNIHWVDLGVSECDKETIGKLLKHQEFVINIINRNIKQLKEDNQYQKMWEELKNTLANAIKPIDDNYERELKLIEELENKYLGVDKQ